MKRIVLLFLILSNLTFGQSPAGIWYFGKKAGLSFNSGPNPVALTNGLLDTDEGCATLCDPNGNLLFYTDGIKVWNRNHLVMPNGNGLLGNPSSTQSAIIVTKPGSTTLFYVFTVDELGKPNGLNYSIIDLTLDGGLGDVTTKNVSLLSPTLEKITAVQHANGTDFWIISHKFNSNQFAAYQLSASGLSSAVISAVGVTLNTDSQRTIGYMKSSPDGKFIACANAGANTNMQLFNFNNATGQLTLLSTTVFGVNSLGTYGLEFSSNSNLLYVTRIDFVDNKSELFQLDISSQNQTTINTSLTMLASQTFDALDQEGIYGALQLAPNQKIYIARTNSTFLSAIDFPNEIGTNCQLTNNAVSLNGKVSSYGLPSFVTSYFELNFTSSNYCLGNPTNFQTPVLNNVISYTWDFDDPTSANNISNAQNPSHVFTAAGTYTVTLTVQTTTLIKTYSKNITIVTTPVANTILPFIKCDENNNQTANFSLSDKNIELLGAQTASNYVINYFATNQDALDKTNPLSQSGYTNTSNPQTIYARIETLDGVCFDITSFDLNVTSLPVLAPDSEVYYCSNYFPTPITITAENQNPSEVLTYLWSNGATTESISINTVGVYTVTATNANGCVTTRTITVKLSGIATINFLTQGSIGNYNIQINAVGDSDDYLYVLDNEFGNYQSSSLFTNVFPGDHIVYVKDNHGCGVVSATFSVLGYPNYFTPNNDGINDYWNIEGSKLNIKKLYIFDRFGKLITEILPNTLGWNGTLNGQLLSSDDYWFYAKLDTGEEIKGHFSLKR
jgi:gliding motility-associated-like protein